MFRSLLALICAAAITAGEPARAEDTLARVKAAGQLSCGVVAEPEDWNKTDLHGSLAPMDGAFCRAFAVAALGPSAKLDIKAFAAEIDAENALSRGLVDVVVGVTPTLVFAMNQGIAFGPPIFYDALGFLARRDADAPSVAGLAGRAVCYIEGTENERLLQARTIAQGINIIPMPFQEQGEMDDGLLNGHCQVEAANVSHLAQTRAGFRNPEDFVFLADTLRLHPVSPAYRQGDPHWAALIDWTVYSVIQAEELGLTHATIGQAPETDDPILHRLTGTDWASSVALGLPKDWSLQVVRSVGNYGEIFEGTVGSRTRLRLPRGPNALWTQGGLMHAWPVQ